MLSVRDLEHRVRSGDTLSEIAESYGIGLSALLRANNLRSRDLIRVGQVLTLPVPGGQALVVLLHLAGQARAVVDGPGVAERPVFVEDKGMGRAGGPQDSGQPGVRIPKVR